MSYEEFRRKTYGDMYSVFADEGVDADVKEKLEASFRKRFDQHMEKRKKEKEAAAEKRAARNKCFKPTFYP